MLKTSLIAFVVAVSCLLGMRPPMDAAEPAPVIGPVIHEWGVFSSHEDTETANADMRAEWDSLPEFVFGQMVGRRGAPLLAVDKPVVFVHSKQPTRLDFRVDFAVGLPAVWWPRDDAPTSGGIRKFDPAAPQPPPKKHVRWVVAAQPGVAGRLERIPAGHWMGELRNTKADHLQPVDESGRPVQSGEKFLYYDGIFPNLRYAKVTVDGPKVTVENVSGVELLDVTVIDRRTAGKVKTAKADSLKGKQSVSFEAPTDITVEAAGKQLVGSLVSAGLFDDEAACFLKAWNDAFLRDGEVTVHYRLPQAEYDRLLPITVKPAPSRTVRVGVVFHPHCGSATEARIAELIKDLDSDDFRKREAAGKKLSEMARASFGALLKRRNAEKDPEIRARLDKALEKFEAEPAVGRR